jgi:hypothetical protein
LIAVVVYYGLCLAWIALSVIGLADGQPAYLVGAAVWSWRTFEIHRAYVLLKEAHDDGLALPPAPRAFLDRDHFSIAISVVGVTLVAVALATTDRSPRTPGGLLADAAWHKSSHVWPIAIDPGLI